MKNQMFMGASTKQGYDIATKSREIIRGLIGDDIKDLAPAERDIVERIVHSTADPEYAKLVHMSADFVEAAMTSLRNKETISFLGVWEELNNENFNFTEFSKIKNKEVGYTSFTLSPKRWIDRTNAIGIYSKGGKYSLGTFAHPDIAFDLLVLFNKIICIC